MNRKFEVGDRVKLVRLDEREKGNSLYEANLGGIFTIKSNRGKWVELKEEGTLRPYITDLEHVFDVGDRVKIIDSINEHSEFRNAFLGRELIIRKLRHQDYKEVADCEDENGVYICCPYTKNLKLLGKRPVINRTLSRKLTVNGIDVANHPYFQYKEAGQLEMPKIENITELKIDNPYSGLSYEWKMPEMKINEIKEENNMNKILEIYKDKKIKEFRNKMEEKIKIIKEDDAISKIITDAENQLNVLLDSEDIELSMLNAEQIYTDETIKKIEEIEKDFHDNKNILNELVDEVEAHLDMAEIEDYKEKMKILENYGIVDKKGKIQ